MGPTSPYLYSFATRILKNGNNPNKILAQKKKTHVTFLIDRDMQQSRIPVQDKL